MSGFASLVLLPVRYLMIGGFVVLGILFYDQLDLTRNGIIDFEKILPSAISEFVPVGLMGLLLAGLLAAFMSTFAGTLNAAQAYLVNDIYLRHKKNAKPKQVTRMNYSTGILVVLISIVLGFYVEDVNSIMQWIVSALWGGYIVSNILKWYWWRFNGEGYFWGMLSGLVPAILFPLIFKETLELYLFPLLLLITILGCIIGTYTAPPTNEAILMNFYKRTRPWGFWKPIHDNVIKTDTSFKKNSMLGNDIFNVIIGTIAQTLLVIIPLYLVLREYTYLIVSLGIFVFCAFLLKKNWWDKLDKQL